MIQFITLDLMFSREGIIQLLDFQAVFSPPPPLCSTEKIISIGHSTLLSAIIYFCWASLMAPEGKVSAMWEI